MSHTQSITGRGESTAEPMEARMQSVASLDLITGIEHLHKAMHAGGVDPLVLELVHLRASQINGCSPCVFAGVQSAKKHGETEERLHSVVTWRETPFFTEEERAALALAEAATPPGLARHPGQGSSAGDGRSRDRRPALPAPRDALGFRGRPP